MLGGAFGNKGSKKYGYNFLRRESVVISIPRRLVEMDDAIILITGGSGFLGQHLVRVLNEQGEGIKEIRVLDLVPYKNKFDFAVKYPVVSIIGDVAQIDEKCKEAFAGVTTVFHCAAFVSYEFPSDRDKLHDVNVKGTKNVVDLCTEYGIKHLVYTSTAEICVKPYFRNSFFSLIINETESKARLPENCEQAVFGYYAWSKLQGENLVTSADGTKHNHGCLRTVSLRPPILYGEHDEGFFPLLIDLGSQLGEIYPRIGGPGGKHQFCYAGNAAWSHLCALKTLQERPDSIGGLPVFITDDTYIYDQLRFCERMVTPTSGTPLIKRSWWYIPLILCFLLSFIYETVHKIVDGFFALPKLRISPKTLVTYLGSVIFFSRLRATIHLHYVPLYPALSALNLSRNYYLRKAVMLHSQSNKKIDYYPTHFFARLIQPLIPQRAPPVQ